MRLACITRSLLGSITGAVGYNSNPTKEKGHSWKLWMKLTDRCSRTPIQERQGLPWKFWTTLCITAEVLALCLTLLRHLHFVPQQSFGRNLVLITFKKAGHSHLMGSYSNKHRNHKIAGPAGQEGQQSSTRTKTNDLNEPQVHPPGPCSHTQNDLTEACDEKR